MLSKWIMPGKKPSGIIVTILIGLAGRVVGGYIASQVGIDGNNVMFLRHRRPPTGKRSRRIHRGGSGA